MHDKHVARWLLVLGGVVVLYYIYKSITSAFAAVTSTLEAPITGIENISGTIWGGITGGISALYSDVKSLGSSLVGGSAANSSSSPPASQVSASLVDNWLSSANSIISAGVNPTLPTFVSPSGNAATSGSTTPTGSGGNSNSTGSNNSTLDLSLIFPGAPASAANPALGYSP